MKKSSVSILLISIFALITSLLVFSYINRPEEHETLLFDEVTVLTASPNYWLSIPASENKGLTNNINSFSFDEEPGVVYLLFPSDFDLSNIVCYVRDSYYQAYLTRLCLDLSEEVTYAGQRIVAYNSVLPSLYYETTAESVSFDTMVSSDDKSNICTGSMTLVVPEDMADTSFIPSVISSDNKNTARLSMRGAGYQAYDKKSFTLAFDESVDLLGFGKQKKYNLLSNNFDQTCLKNYIFYNMADRFGLDYTPRLQNVSLFVNGDYQGIYSLTTKVSVNKNRIPLSYGDYLINFGARQPQIYVLYDSETYFCDSDLADPYFGVLYPEWLSDTTEIHDIVQKFISSIEDTSDTTYLQYMDLDSMVRYYLVQEIGQNYDAFFRSTYAYYLREDGKLHMGPIWDMDLTLGNNFDKEGVMFNTSDGWKVRQLSWYPRLFARKEFENAVIDTYNSEHFDDILRQLSDEFKMQEELLAVDGELNYKMWRHVINANTLQQRRTTYKEYTDQIIAFYDERIDWIDSQLKR